MMYANAVQLGVYPPEAVVKIGDTLPDIDEGLNAGAWAVGVTLTGNEIGLTEAEVPYESLQDPYGIAFWPQFKGRDGCRTPIPWSDDAQAGFSRGIPWLPVPREHRALAVERQETDPHSVLNGFRTSMLWRQSQPALRWGDIEFIDTAEPVLA